ncbi:MAG: twin-arginine translocase TatA/TatE family subunit [Microbacterium sp.]|uniref:twin-arginine translocase TatA/TatE family subunit n=1 Tax=Microbacterium sp. TaxID=51671 RepID=UPI0039E52822
MLQNLTGWHALLILAIVVLIFGAAKLPGLARSVGQSMRILKDESKDATASRTDADLVRDELAARATATPVTTAVSAAAEPATTAPAEPRPVS